MAEPARAYAHDGDEQMAAEVRASLLSKAPHLPSKFFYDDRGSRLFEQITRTPEYYQTRTEEEILRSCAYNVVARVAPHELVELGGGVSPKVRMLLDAMKRAGALRRCVLFDIHRASVESSLAQVGREYPGVAARGLVGDFMGDLTALGPGGRRLIAFLGGTIGNLHPTDEVPGFLARLREQMADGDALLVGLDLVKDTAEIERAYNDAEGITAAFNLNLLDVMNRRLHADFDRDAFAHVAFYDERNAWIEMRVRALRPQVVDVPGADLTLHFDEGDELRTEISCKYTRASFARRLAPAGLRLDAWYTDTRGLFALALVRPAYRVQG